MLNEQLPGLASYYPSLFALTLLCIAILIQSFLAGAIGLGKSNEVPGKALQGSHADFTFRTIRTYGNSVENLPMFGFIVFLAIISGASAGLVNGLVILHVVLRLVYWVVYYSGVGKVAAGPRTMVYVAGWFVNLMLALVTLWAFF